MSVAGRELDLYLIGDFSRGWLGKKLAPVDK